MECGLGLLSFSPTRLKSLPHSGPTHSPPPLLSPLHGTQSLKTQDLFLIYIQAPAPHDNPSIIFNFYIAVVEGLLFYSSCVLSGVVLSCLSKLQYHHPTTTSVTIDHHLHLRHLGRRSTGAQHGA